MESDKAGGLNTFNINITWSPRRGPPGLLGIHLEMVNRGKSTNSRSCKQRGKSCLANQRRGCPQIEDEIRPVGSFHVRRYPQMWARRGDVEVRETDMTLTCVAEVSCGADWKYDRVGKGENLVFYLIFDPG